MPFWILLFIVTVGAFAALVGYILPAIFLVNNYEGGKVGDRGIKKYRLRGKGYAISYEPEISIRKYVSKYVLSECEGKKKLSFKLAAGVSFIDFDVLLFDSNGEAFLSLNSKNILNGDEPPEDIELPARTAYVSLSLNQVDGERIENKRTLRFSIPRLSIYFTVVSLLSVGFAFVVRLCLGNIFGDVFREDFIGSVTESAIIAIVAALLAVAASALTCVLLVRKNNNT